MRRITPLDALAFVVLGVAVVGFTVFVGHAMAKDPELRVALALSAGVFAGALAVWWAIYRVALWARGDREYD